MPFDPNALSASVRARWQAEWEPLRAELVAEFARLAATPGLDEATRAALIAQGQLLLTAVLRLSLAMNQITCDVLAEVIAGLEAPPDVS